MADKKTCGERIHNGFPIWLCLCLKPAKFMCEVKGDGALKRTKTIEPRCGIHAKRYEKVEKL